MHCTHTHLTHSRSQTTLVCRMACNNTLFGLNIWHIVLGLLHLFVNGNGSDVVQTLHMWNRKWDRKLKSVRLLVSVCIQLTLLTVGCRTPYLLWIQLNWIESRKSWLRQTSDVKCMHKAQCEILHSQNELNSLKLHTVRLLIITILTFPLYFFRRWNDVLHWSPLEYRLFWAKRLTVRFAPLFQNKKQRASLSSI